MGFGVPNIDEGGVKTMIMTLAAIQERNIVIMEVRGNATKEDRVEAVKKFKLPHFRKVAQVMIGEPDDEFKERTYKQLRQEKQEKLDAAFAAKKAELQRKRVIDLRIKQVEKARRKQERINKRLAWEKRQAEKKKRKEEAEEERKKKEEEAKEKKETDGEDKTESKEEEKKEEDNAAKEEEKKEDSDEEMKPEVDESDEEKPEPEPLDNANDKPPVAELTEEEKLDFFRRPQSQQLPDLAPFVLNTSFAKFSLPLLSEGFDEVRYGWNKADACEPYLRDWVRARKLTTRIEDIVPSDWFKEKWQDWQKNLQSWHMRHVEHKNSDPATRAAAAARGKAKAQAKAKSQGTAALEGGDAEKTNEAKETGVASDKKNESTNRDGEESKDPLQQLEDEMDADDLDVFGVEDVNDVGNGEPLFGSFAFEDWALLSLRFELHLLVHAFRNDAKDPERTGIHPEHISFYYNKYYKKGISPKNYNVEKIEDLIDLVKDSVIVGVDSKVAESQLTDDLESNDIFVKLTEESRRDRQRRIDAGDATAALKFTRPSGLPTTTSATSAATSTPSNSAPLQPQVQLRPLASGPYARPGYVPRPQQQWYAPRVSPMGSGMGAWGSGMGGSVRPSSLGGMGKGGYMQQGSGYGGIRPQVSWGQARGWKGGY